MEVDNETRPLLHDFETETWRSKARRKCLRIPSEVAITGIILGLFFVVVTLLIVLENMEETKETDLSLDKNLLASPFKYNKKVEDKTWQDKKEGYMKEKKDYKWDNANKGWKKFPDITGKLLYKRNDGMKTTFKTEADNLDDLEFPTTEDEYGRELDDSIEALFDMEQSSPMYRNKFDEDMAELARLIKSSGLKMQEIDDGWRKLSEQGWKDKQIRQALFKVLREKKQELYENKGLLQSPMKLDEMWDTINDKWKKKIQEEIENQKMKNKKEADFQKNINDKWQKDMTPLQSPKAKLKEYVNENGGWEIFSKQGAKKGEIKRQIINAWKEKKGFKTYPANLQSSPMNIESLWTKATDFLKNMFQKGLDKEKSQKDINDDWKNKFGSLLQSPMLSSSKKWKYKKSFSESSTTYDKGTTETADRNEEQENYSQSPLTVDDFMENIIDTILELHKNFKDKFTNKEDPQTDIQQSSVKLEDFMDEIIDAIKEHRKNSEKEQKDKSSDVTEKSSTDNYSTVESLDFLEDIINTIKDFQKGNKQAENQKSINDKWKNNMNVLHTSKTSDQKWKKIDEHLKTVIEHERNSYFGRNDNTGAPSSEESNLQYSMGLDSVKRDYIDDGWKKRIEQDLKDKDIKNAVYQALKNGDKLLQSAVGSNNMKWKKVDDGWKKISNKS